MSQTPTDRDPRWARCSELFTAHQRRLSMFIGAMVVNPSDADEILGETNAVIWKKIDTFDPDAPGSDFLAWAYQIARYQVLEYRRQKGRASRMFGSDVLDQLAARYVQDEPMLEARREALAHCMKALPADDHRLLEACYLPSGSGSVAQVAEQMDRKTTSVYRSLRRIRQILADCIDRRVAQEGA